MMSILTGLILVVVLGAIVQKSDTLMDAFSDFTEETPEEAGVPADATLDQSGDVEAALSGSTAEPAVETPPSDGVESRAGDEGKSPRVAMTTPSDVAGYRSALDDVTLEAGGTYSIDVLGNDIGVTGATYGRLVLLSSPKCGIARLVEGRVAYFADELCRGAQHIFYCIEGADAQQCEEGVLTINIVQPANATLDPAGLFLNDVTPNTDGIYTPDRSPKIDTSIDAPVVDERPSTLASVKSPIATRTTSQLRPAAIGMVDDSGVRFEAPSRNGLFAEPIADGAAPPVAEARVDRPDAVAPVDAETRADPLTGPVRTVVQDQDGLTSPLPVAKPGLIDHDAPEAPKVNETGALQSPIGGDVDTPSGGAVATRVRVGGASKVELTFQRSDAGRPPNTRAAALGALGAPEISGDTPEIAALSATEVVSAGTLDSTDYASVASLAPAEGARAIAVKRIARLPDAPESAGSGPDRAPGGLQMVNVEKGTGGAGGFMLRDRATRSDDADEAQPLSSFLQTLSSQAPDGAALGLEKVTFEDPVADDPAARTSDTEGRRIGRVEIATSGGFTLRDRPAKAIPRESLGVDPDVASSETPAIAPVETAALNLDKPNALTSDADGAVKPARTRGPAQAADCDVEFSVVGARGALIRAEAASPCRAGQVVRFAHHGVEFATRFDASGLASLLLPALSRDGVVLARTEDAQEVYARATVPGTGRVSRVALIWRDAVDLNLHAFEYGAGLGAMGHIWAGSPQDIADYKRGRAGLLQVFRPIDGYGDNIEVYSFAPGSRSTAGAVELAIEFASRGETPASPYCKGGELASPRYTIFKLENGKAEKPVDGAIAAARCGAPLAADVRYQRGLLPEIVVSK